MVESSTGLCCSWFCLHGQCLMRIAERGFGVLSAPSERMYFLWATVRNCAGSCWLAKDMQMFVATCLPATYLAGFWAWCMLGLLSGWERHFPLPAWQQKIDLGLTLLWSHSELCCMCTTVFPCEHLCLTIPYLQWWRSLNLVIFWNAWPSQCHQWHQQKS